MAKNASLEVLNLGPLSILFISFISLVIIAVFAMRLGFFKIKEDESAPCVNLIHLLLGFALYLGFIYFFANLLVNILSTHISKPYINAVLTNIIVIFLVALSFIIFLAKTNNETRRYIIKQRVKQPTSVFFDIFIGIISWIIVFPAVQFISDIIEIFLRSVLKITQIPQQSIIHLLKTIAPHTALYIIFLISICVFVPFVEEILFRGLLQNYLKKYMGKLLSIIISSICFSIFHFSFSQGWGNLLILITLFFLSCFLGFLYERQKSIFSPIALHATFNFIGVFSILLKHG
jgi:uncharacterized protein